MRGVAFNRAVADADVNFSVEVLGISAATVGVCTIFAIRAERVGGGCGRPLLGLLCFGSSLLVTLHPLFLEQECNGKDQRRGFGRI